MTVSQLQIMSSDDSGPGKLLGSSKFFLCSFCLPTFPFFFSDLPFLEFHPDPPWGQPHWVRRQLCVRQLSCFPPVPSVNLTALISAPESFSPLRFFSAIFLFLAIRFVVDLRRYHPLGHQHAAALCSSF